MKHTKKNYKLKDCLVPCCNFVNDLFFWADCIENIVYSIIIISYPTVGNRMIEKYNIEKNIWRFHSFCGRLPHPMASGPIPKSQNSSDLIELNENLEVLWYKFCLTAEVRVNSIHARAGGSLKYSCWSRVINNSGGGCKYFGNYSVATYSLLADEYSSHCEALVQLSVIQGLVQLE